MHRLGEIVTYIYIYIYTYTHTYTHITKDSDWKYVKNSYKTIRKKTTNFWKIGKGLEQALHQENIQMGNKYMKMYSVLLFIREMKTWDSTKPPPERQKLKWLKLWRVLRREWTYVYLWLIHADIWQKLTQYCEAIILQLVGHLGLVKVLKMAGWKLALKATD